MRKNTHGCRVVHFMQSREHESNRGVALKKLTTVSVQQNKQPVYLDINTLTPELTSVTENTLSVCAINVIPTDSESREKQLCSDL